MLTVQSIPAFKDNYIWLLQSPEKHCIVIDPGDAKPVIEAIEKQQLTLDAILITHHHNDHCGGISELKRRYPSINVVGPQNNPIPGLTQSVEDGDQVDIFGERFMVLAVLGHTHGHVAYVGDEKLFCGDTLFLQVVDVYLKALQKRCTPLYKKLLLCPMKPKFIVPTNIPQATSLLP